MKEPVAARGGRRQRGRKVRGDVWGGAVYDGCRGGG